MLKAMILCMFSAYLHSALASEVPIVDHPIDTSVCADDSLSPKPVLPPYEWSCVNKKGEEERSISLSDLCRKNVAHSLVLKDPRRPTDLKNWVCQATPRGSYQMNQVLAGGWIHLGMPMPPLKYKGAKKSREIKQQFDQAFDRVIPRRAKWMVWSEDPASLPFGDIGLVMFWKNDESSRARFEELLSLKNDLESEIPGKTRLYVIPLETPKNEGDKIWNPGNIPPEWRELYDLRKKGAIVPMHWKETISGFTKLARTTTVSSISNQILIIDRHNFVRATTSDTRIVLAKKKATQAKLSLASITLEAFSEYALNSAAKDRNLDDLVSEMVTTGVLPKSIEDAPETITLSPDLLSNIHSHENTTKRLGKEIGAEIALLGSKISLTEGMVGEAFSVLGRGQETIEPSIQKLLQNCPGCYESGRKMVHIGYFHTHPGEYIFSNADLDTFNEFTPIRIVGAPNDLQFLALQTLENLPYQRNWHMASIFEAAQFFLLGKSPALMSPVLPSKPHLQSKIIHDLARYQGLALYAGRGGKLEKIVVEEGMTSNEIDQFGDTTKLTILSGADAARNRFLLGSLVHLATGDQKKQLSEISQDLFFGKDIPEYILTRWKEVIRANKNNKEFFLNVWPSNFAIGLLVGELTYFNGNSKSGDMMGSFSLLSKRKASDRTALFLLPNSYMKDETVVVMAHLKQGESDISGWVHLVNQKKPFFKFGRGNIHSGCEGYKNMHAIFILHVVDDVTGNQETISSKCQLDTEYDLSREIDKGEYQIGKTIKDCPGCPDMVIVPSGNFEMGRKGNPYVEPLHQVNISGFALGKTEVTRGQFADFLMATGYKREGSCFFTNSKGAKKIPLNSWHKLVVEQRESYSYPMDCVSWDDAQAYVQWLSLKAGKNYRLPTEAEWEYACRAGGRHDFCGSNNPDEVAWHEKNSDYATHQVATRRPNAFGLFDMSGNVEEWTQDCFNDNYMGAPKDGRPWLSGDCNYRPTRGGHFGSDLSGIQSSSRGDTPRSSRDHMFGFRTARSLP